MGLKLDFGGRLGLGGLVVGLFALAAFYVWPNERRIGLISLGVAGVLVACWVIAELRQWKAVPKSPPVRIIGLYLRPIVMGSPVALIVRIVNEHNRTAKVISKFSATWVTTLPKETDHIAIENIEAFAWRQLTSGEPTSTGEQSGARPVPLPLPPKMEVNVTDESLIIATQEAVRSLDEESALYFCGTFTDERSGGVTSFCVRIDKFRESQGLTLCREHN